MKSEQAYRAIVNAIERDPSKELVDARYFEELSGSFVISYTDASCAKSIVCDKGEIAACRGLEGSDGCEIVIPWVFDFDETTLLRDLALELR